MSAGSLGGGAKYFLSGPKRPPSFLRECGNTLYPPHGQNQNHGFSFWFQFPFFCRLPRKKWVLVSGKSGFSFWFQFCLREGVGVFLPPQSFSRAEPWGVGWYALSGPVWRCHETISAIPPYCALYGLLSVSTWATLGAQRLKTFKVAHRDRKCQASRPPNPYFRAGPKGVSTKGVSMKRSNFLHFKAFYTVVSKGKFRKSPRSWIPLFWKPFWSLPIFSLWGIPKLEIETFKRD